MERKCGECHACCITLGIEDLNKPKDTPCPHLKTCGTRRCGIYDTRPGECADFACAWKRGFTKARYRPDRCGVLFYASESTFGSSLVAAEMWAGASSRGDGAIAVAQASSECHDSGLHLLIRTAAEGVET